LNLLVASFLLVGNIFGKANYMAFRKETIINAIN